MSSTKSFNGLPVVELHGMALAACTETELLDAVFAALDQGHGGWLITANLDFLRRYDHDARIRSLYAQADIRVADGMPLVWAARIQGTPLPQRIAGSSLLRPMARLASLRGRRVYFLGGDVGAAEAAARRLWAEFPGFQIAGVSSPMLPAEPQIESLAATQEQLLAAQPDIVLVAFGSPKQEWVISRLRASFPKAWFVGVGMSFSFTASQRPRAPGWMQTSGLEWVHRLASEPRRLGKRYLVHDAPFGAKLLARALLRRLTRPQG